MSRPAIPHPDGASAEPDPPAPKQPTFLELVAQHLVAATRLEMTASSYRADAVSEPSYVFEVALTSGRVVVGWHRGTVQTQYSSARETYQIEVYDGADNLLAQASGGWVNDVFKHLWGVHSAMTRGARTAIVTELEGLG